ncbi:MAG TPA: hypothetical protein EYN71_03810 [Flavobacteriales bacterium]|nr:hypothetical protein [Flavobacteriales bacterium]
MKFPCPNCEQNLEIGDDLVGTTFLCPSCGKSILVEAQDETDSRKEEAIPPIIKEQRVVPNHSFGLRKIISLVGCIVLLIYFSIYFGALDFLVPYYGESASNQSETTKSEKNNLFNYSESIDPIDGSKSYTFIIAEKDTQSHQIAISNFRSLIISQRNNKTEILFMPKSLKWVDVNRSSVSVTMRIDDEVRTSNWDVKQSKSRQALVIYSGNKIELIKELLKIKYLAIRVHPKTEPEITAVFDLNGIDEAIKPMKPVLNL